MSLPRELLDQLLSGYLDDALSPDERARVEQLLQSDDEIVKELDQLRELQRSLQAISAADSTVKLEKGFADRVLGAAVARAHAEGLSDDHPLIRLAEQPSTSRTGSSRSSTGRNQYRSSSLRVAGLLIGLAASIVIAVIAFRPDSSTTVQNQPDIKSLAGPEVTPSMDSLEDPSEAPIEVPAPEMIVSNQPANPNLLNPNSANSVTPNPVIEPVISTDSPMKQIQPPPAPIEAIAKADDPVGPSAVTKIDIPDMNLGAILVLDVRRTEAGRNADPIGDALRYAKIAPASEKKITEEIAGFAKSTSGDADENASILYLQVSGKKFDLFYDRLWDNEVDIESIGLRLAFDPPIKKMVDAIRPDPTTVRHDDAALQLFSDGGIVDEFTSHLSKLRIRPLDRKSGDAVPTSTGPDISAQVLVLVR